MGTNPSSTVGGADSNNTFLPPAEDKKILKLTTSLSQNIQQHVTNFYRTDTTFHPDPNPFDFVPTTAKGLEIALRRCVARSILGFINDTIKYGVDDDGLIGLSSELCQQLQEFRDGTMDDKSRPHLQALFRSGRDLAGMLASRDGWNFDQWDGVSNLDSEESQMELLVFPGLLNSGKYVRQGDLGSGKRGIGTEVKGTPKGENANGSVTAPGGENKNPEPGKLKRFRQSTRKALRLADFINQSPDVFSDKALDSRKRFG